MIAATGERINTWCDRTASGLESTSTALSYIDEDHVCGRRKRHRRDEDGAALRVSSTAIWDILPRTICRNLMEELRIWVASGESIIVIYV